MEEIRTEIEQAKRKQHPLEQWVAGLSREEARRLLEYLRKQGNAGGA